MYSAKPGRRQNNNKTEKNTCKDTDTILRSLEIRIKKAKIYPKASNSVNTYFDYNRCKLAYSFEESAGIQ